MVRIAFTALVFISLILSSCHYKIVKDTNVLYKEEGLVVYGLDGFNYFFPCRVDTADWAKVIQSNKMKKGIPYGWPGPTPKAYKLKYSRPVKTDSLMLNASDHFYIMHAFVVYYKTDFPNYVSEKTDTRKLKIGGKNIKFTMSTETYEIVETSVLLDAELKENIDDDWMRRGIKIEEPWEYEY